MPKKLPASHFIPYDEEEKELMELDISEFDLNSSDRKRDEDIIAIIENFKKEQKKKTISIRLRNSSIERIKKFAKKQDIPYQTLINMQIDKFAESLESV